jgi:hypothetical protein
VSLPPLTRRRLLSSLDEDEAPEWPPSERARFIDRARRREAARDHRLREQGERLLAEFQGDGMSNGEAFRAFMFDLLEPQP